MGRAAGDGVATLAPGQTGRTWRCRLASELVKNLIESGIHFGHRASRWNPKMQPYIFGKRNLIHIIDIRETVKGLLRARKFVAGVAAKGDDILFVGTKRQARSAVISAAQRTNMHYVAERWLGGTLTNFRTIRSRLARLEELETIEQSGMVSYSKKMVATLTRERRKIKRNLDGIRKMSKLPGALMLVDVKREHIAAREARKLGIPVIALIDTDSDPDTVDIPIPGNDDAMRAIDLICDSLADAVLEGMRSRPKEEPQAQAPRPPRRSGRATARAVAPAEPADSGEAAPSEQGARENDSQPVAST
ncbi:MAG: 30S ribosomal protein S2 [Planctomycetes bacterium]|nr:30S ribosomal protein S2 [Planctomycetota bacterium]